MAAIVLLTPRCARCASTMRVDLARQITASGVSQVAWYCNRCRRWAETPVRWLGHATLNGREIDSLPIVNDYSAASPCIICGQPGEWMHWAPQALAEKFGSDWTRWPQDPLCVPHHTQWHRLVWPGDAHGNK